LGYISDGIFLIHCDLSVLTERLALCFRCGLFI
jgi:hypothetical protein